MSDQADTVAAARAEVQQTREELGETVEALAHKADVKARAHEKADEIKARAQESAQQLQAKAHELAAKAQAKAQERAGADVADVPPPPTPQEQVQGRPASRAQLAAARVRQLPPPALAGIATGAAVLLAVVLARRRR